MSDQNKTESTPKYRLNPKLAKIFKPAAKLAGRAVNDLLDTSPRDVIVGSLKATKSLGDAMVRAGSSLRIKKDKSIKDEIIELTLRDANLNMAMTMIATEWEQTEDEELRKALGKKLDALQEEQAEVGRYLEELYYLLSKPDLKV